MGAEPLTGTDKEREREQRIKEVTDRLGVWSNWDRLNESPPVSINWDLTNPETSGIHKDMVDLRDNVLFRGTETTLTYWPLGRVYGAWMQCFGPRYHHPSLVLTVNFRYWLGVPSNGKGWRPV